jgi:hypothetical protein
LVVGGHGLWAGRSRGLDACHHIANGEDKVKVQFDEALAQHPEMARRAMVDGMKARVDKARSAPSDAKMGKLLADVTGNSELTELGGLFKAMTTA